MIGASGRQVNKVDLTPLDPLDPLLELMYFGLKGLTREADERLASHGLSRVHHRILFVIGRRDGITVGELHAMLGVTKQALHGPLRRLTEAGLVEVRRDAARHRAKPLHLTESGRRVEDEASGCERRVMDDALRRFGEAERRAWATVMRAIAAHA
ncbi:MAG TPA: MarR family winged helix-turn-helix transcriptional regulator [Burkholderiaceae bacterium]|nr:MarR family winged helix-turn-helix transcriptional regulator [Burkholderiaceae bacterium]